MSVETDNAGGFNRVVLIGEVSSEMISRELADGSVMSAFDVVTSTEDGRVTVPVCVSGEPSVVELGMRVCVVGFVRRRFFRAGASVTSRTEVVAHVISPLRRKAQVRKALTLVAEDLSGLEDL